MYECSLFTSDIECGCTLTGAGIVITMVSIVVGDVRRVMKDNGAIGQIRFLFIISVKEAIRVTLARASLAANLEVAMP